MQNLIIRQYTKLVVQSLADPVSFAEKFLKFHPFPYQEPFLRDQSPLIAACCGRQVGKTTLSAIKALHYALSNHAIRVLIVSAGLRQSMILFDKIFQLVTNSIPAKLLLTYSSRTKLQFANGSEIIALPCGNDGTTLRGYTADMVILDEANFIPRIIIESVIRPTTITRPNARMIMISTPWTKDHPFYEALNKPELGFHTYNWPTHLNPSVTTERLELEKQSIGEYDFNREYNGIFLGDQYTYFPSNLVLNCTDDYPLNNEPDGQKYTGHYQIGIDFGKHVDHTAIAILHNTKNQQRLIYLREFQLKTPYKQVIEALKILNVAYNFTSGCLDKTGVGEAPYEEIQNFIPQLEGITLTIRTKENILSKLRLAMEQHKIILPRDNKTILNQITSQQSKPSGTNGQLKFNHPPGTKDDQLWALALANYPTTQEYRTIAKPIIHTN